MRLGPLVPAVVLATLLAAAAAERGGNARHSVLSPGAKVFARFASARYVPRLRPFSDFEALYCLNRTQEFLQLAALTEVRRPPAPGRGRRRPSRRGLSPVPPQVSSSELPGLMTSLCHNHLCHFKRTGTVWHVNAVVRAPPPPAPPRRRRSGLTRARAPARPSRPAAQCGEVNTLFEERHHKHIGVDAEPESTARRYCEALAQDPGPTPETAAPFHAKPFHCPLHVYEQGVEEQLEDAAERREEEDSTPSPVYVPVDQLA